MLTFFETQMLPSEGSRLKNIYGPKIFKIHWLHQNQKIWALLKVPIWKKVYSLQRTVQVFNINWNIGKGCQSTSQNDAKKPLSYCHCQELKTVFLRWKLYCTCWAARTFWYKIFVRQGECAVATSSHFRPRLRVDNKISFPIASKIWWNPMQLFLSGKRRKIFPKGTSKIYI